MHAYKKLITYFILTTISCCTIAMDTEQTLSWAQKTVTQLTLKEKVGQLFMVAAISDTVQNPGFLEHTPYTMDEAYIKHLITNYHVGGVIFLGLSTAQKQYELTQQFQQLSVIPLLIGQDLEWGLHMRLRDAIQFPYALTLGAIQDNELIYQLGKEIGRQCKAIGAHINFAPVADINTNPNNPVINHRSFGDNPENVSHKTAAFAHGLHDAGIIACAKHFPGHGDTAVDSHYDLPIIRHDKNRLHTTELTPFKHLIANNIPAIMTAHIAVPALEKQANIPASLSYDIVTNLLKNELGFSGLVITDGLGMQGVTKNHKPGYVELNALRAGNDILLCPVDVPQAVELIMHAIENKQFSEEELDARVLKILAAKEWVLSQSNFDLSVPFDTFVSDKSSTNTQGERTYDKPVRTECFCGAKMYRSITDISYTHETLHTQDAYDFKQKLYQHALTIVRDTHNSIPCNATQPITILQIGCTELQPFALTLQKSMPNANAYSYHLDEQLPTDQPIIIALHGMNRLAREQYGITELIQKVIKEIHTHNNNIMLIIFGNPYSCALFDYIPGLMCAYQDDSDAQSAAADVVLGKLQAKGKLPVII